MNMIRPNGGEMNPELEFSPDASDPNYLYSIYKIAVRVRYLFGIGRMTKKSYQIIMSGLSLLLLSGCNKMGHWGSTEEVVLPESPPLEAQELQSVAENCRKNIEGLETRRPYVPKERRSEFNTVLGIATDNCHDLESTFTRLKQATYQKEAFAQNIQHAESTIINQKKLANGIEEGSLSDFAEFEQDDHSEIDLKPLE
jgi:hypothetical protein